MSHTAVAVRSQTSLHDRLLEHPGSLAFFPQEAIASDRSVPDLVALSASPRTPASVRPVSQVELVKKLRKRNQAYQDARDATRRTQWRTQKSADGVVVRGSLPKIVDLKVIGGFTGPKDASAATAPTPRIVAYNGGSAASVLDLEGRLIAYRGYEGLATRAVNAAAVAAAAYLSDNEHIKTTTEDGSRGAFKKYYFILHRESSKYPRMHSYFLKNREVGFHVAGLLQPLLRLMNAVFQERFPALYRYYEEALRFVLDRHGDLVAPMFPFASFAINTGDVVAKPHRNCLNFSPGLCCIIPFGTFDPFEYGLTTLLSDFQPRSARAAIPTACQWRCYRPRSRLSVEPLTPLLSQQSPCNGLLLLPRQLSDVESRSLP